MLLWDTLHFAGLGFQIVAGIAGAFSLSWIRRDNKHAEINLEKLMGAKLTGKIALGFFTVGAILILWYEIHLLQTG